VSSVPADSSVSVCVSIRGWGLLCQFMRQQLVHALTEH